MQAIISKTPLIELTDGSGDLKSERYKGFGGFGHLFTDYNASCYAELSEALEDIAKERKETKVGLLDEYWHKCSETTATSRFAEFIYNEYKTKSQIPLSYYSGTLNAYHKFAKKKNIIPHLFKWPDNCSTINVTKKISKYMQLLKLRSISISEVASSLYLIKNEDS